MRASPSHVGTSSALLLLPAILVAAPPQGTRSVGVGPLDAAGPLGCAESVADQAAAGCLQASSTPTLGLLFPYPGTMNAFVAPAVVAGGADNAASGSYAAVGGGTHNTASGTHSTVAGGRDNLALEGWGAVGGGLGNYVSGGWFGTIAGGYNNDAVGLATVGGGGGYYGNLATGSASTIPGGYNNTASGSYSFAAGSFARALHSGSFVWGDSVAVSKDSSAVDQFNVYASGGARVFSNAAATTGVLLAPGGGSWTSVSDRDAKENVVPVDPRDVLERLAEVPVSTWNYRAQDDSVRHMGPMAQDFHAAFGLGLGDRTIDTIDPDGVALAAIQGLHALVQEVRAENVRLRADLTELRSALADPDR